MKILIVYSSVTGNTRLVAEGIAKALSGTPEIYPVRKAPSPVDYELILLGFWVYKGKPDPRMLRYMQTVQSQKVAVFGTLAAWPDSSHAKRVLEHTRQVLSGNALLAEFLCLGKLSPQRFNGCMDPAYVTATHPMTPERKARLFEGQTHPDSDDIARAGALFRDLVSRLAEPGGGRDGTMHSA